MKSKKKQTPSPGLEELIPLLIAEWRRLHKFPAGPLDRLQSREFELLIKEINERQKEKDLSSKESLGGYLLYDWILYYQQGLSLVQELPETPYRVLDLFAGAAPFALAALRNGSREVFALDTESSALKIGASLCGKFGYPVSIRDHLCQDIKFPVPGKWDLITIGHALFSTIRGETAQTAYIQSLLRLLNPRGHLLIVESSSTPENRQFLKLRDNLVSEGAVIAAPCVWKGNCPALQHSSSLCFAQRQFEKPFLVKEIQRTLGINLSSLKMSYLILKNPSSTWPEFKEKPLYRVVSPPIDTFRGKRFFLCGTIGKRTLGTRLKLHPKHNKAFEYLKRGDLLSVENAFEVKDDLEITQDTLVKLEAAHGKPAPATDCLDEAHDL